MPKKAQIWGIDLAIALIIFSIGIIVLYVYSLNSPAESKENMENLLYEGNAITEIILSEGSPLNWSIENVTKLGILTNNKIDETKIKNFYNFTQTDYNKTKSIFNTRFDYLFFLSEPIMIDSLEVPGLGKPGINKENINSRNLIKITRFTVYKEKPVTAYLYIWE